MFTKDPSPKETNKNDDIEYTLSLARDIRSKANALLQAAGMTEQELENKLQDPNFYPDEVKEVINEYATKVELTIQRAIDEAHASRLKKEEAAERSKMSRWIHVK